MRPRRNRRHPWVGAVVVTGLLTAAGCGDDPGGARDAVPVVRVTAGSGATGGEEYRFDIPDEVGAGPVRLSLSNDGTEDHHAQVFRLDRGADLDDLRAALATGDPAAALEVGTFVGGTGLVSPGHESQADAVLDLDSGRHVLLCFVPDAAGVPHVAHGMLGAFDVGPAGGDHQQPPADNEVDLVDYGFTAPDTLDGDATLAVTNRSSAEAHEMVVARLDEGVTVDDVVDALHAHEPLPAGGVGGMQAMLPDGTQHLQLDLPPGRYVLICAVTSPTGTAHYDAGMIQEVEVT
jgi:hypothetical protein